MLRRDKRKSTAIRAGSHREASARLRPGIGIARCGCGQWFTFAGLKPRCPKCGQC